MTTNKHGPPAMPANRGAPGLNKDPVGKHTRVSTRAFWLGEGEVWV
ncbi:hypothetical protein [Gaoshiqia sp. Z1-71]